MRSLTERTGGNHVIDDMNIIEQAEANARAMRDEIERLRAAGDALADALRSGSDSGWDKAIDDWEEARRG